MTIKELAEKDQKYAVMIEADLLAESYAKIDNLSKKVEELENVIINLNDRINWLESKV